jgi:hypothetical protein
VGETKLAGSLWMLMLSYINAEEARRIGRKKEGLREKRGDKTKSFNLYSWICLQWAVLRAGPCVLGQFLVTNFQYMQIPTTVI